MNGLRDGSWALPNPSYKLFPGQIDVIFEEFTQCLQRGASVDNDGQGEIGRTGRAGPSGAFAIVRCDAGSSERTIC